MKKSRANKSDLISLAISAAVRLFQAALFTVILLGVIFIIGSVVEACSGFVTMGFGMFALFATAGVLCLSDVVPDDEGTQSGRGQRTGKQYR